MFFNTPFFLLCFLPLILALAWFARGHTRLLAILLGSIFFYAWGEPWFVFLVIASAGLDYALGHRIATASVGRRRLLVGIGVVANLALLVYFKYFAFVLGNLDAVLTRLGMQGVPIWNILLPLGISFIIFEKITYLVDIARGICHPAEKFHHYLLYVFFFPKLLAGPIVKYHDFAPQMHTRDIGAEDLAAGFSRFSLGLAKKVFLADSMGELVDRVFGFPNDAIGTGSAWLGVIAFSLQIYFDFSGYSDMAIGLARLMGFRLLENFNQPYIARSFTDFWRRWHISLSTWIREYLYIPLGGNRHGTLRTYANLWICFLLSGLWHGASWTYVLWGAYHGTFLVMDRVVWHRFEKRLPAVLTIALTFCFVTLGWVIFRCVDLAQLAAFSRALAGAGAEQPAPLYMTRDHAFFLALGLAVSFLATTPPVRACRDWLQFNPHHFATRMGLAAGLFLLVLGTISVRTFQTFLYFRF